MSSINIVVSGKDVQSITDEMEDELSSSSSLDAPQRRSLLGEMNRHIRSLLSNPNFSILLENGLIETHIKLEGEAAQLSFHIDENRREIAELTLLWRDTQHSIREHNENAFLLAQQEFQEWDNLQANIRKTEANILAEKNALRLLREAKRAPERKVESSIRRIEMLEEQLDQLRLEEQELITEDSKRADGISRDMTRRFALGMENILPEYINPPSLRPIILNEEEAPESLDDLESLRNSLIEQFYNSICFTGNPDLRDIASEFVGEEITLPGPAKHAVRKPKKFPIIRTRNLDESLDEKLRRKPISILEQADIERFIRYPNIGYLIYEYYEKRLTTLGVRLPPAILVKPIVAKFQRSVDGKGLRVSFALGFTEAKGEMKEFEAPMIMGNMTISPNMALVHSHREHKGFGLAILEDTSLIKEANDQMEQDPNATNDPDFYRPLFQAQAYKKREKAIDCVFQEGKFTTFEDVIRLMLEHIKKEIDSTGMTEYILGWHKQEREKVCEVMKQFSRRNITDESLEYFIDVYMPDFLDIKRGLNNMITVDNGDCVYAAIPIFHYHGNFSFEYGCRIIYINDTNLEDVERHVNLVQGEVEEGDELIINYSNEYSLAPGETLSDLVQRMESDFKTHIDNYHKSHLEPGLLQD